jgi:hypothetical protein
VATVECANTNRCGSDNWMESAGATAEDGQSYVARAACGAILLRGTEEACQDAVAAHRVEVRVDLGKPPLELNENAE